MPFASYRVNSAPSMDYRVKPMPWINPERAPKSPWLCD